MAKGNSAAQKRPASGCGAPLLSNHPETFRCNGLLR